MKKIEDYTIYCTPEQTNKAIKLGCPCDSPEDYSPIKLPTTQQMIGWLRENYNLFCGVDIGTNIREYSITNNCSYMFYKFNSCGVFPNTVRHSMNVYTYREAELAAIDVALDYLEKGETDV